MSENKVRRWPALCVDLESFDTRPTGKILEIGAVFFDPKTGELGPEFSVELNPEHYQQAQRTVDLDTVMWWMERKKDGIEIPGFKEENASQLYYALNEFYAFISRSAVDEFLEVWAWGSDFDFPMLKSAHDDMDLVCPWNYGRQRDARTFCKMMKIDRSGEVLHRALPDAKQEATAIMRALYVLDYLKEKAITVTGWAYSDDYFPSLVKPRINRPVTIYHFSRNGGKSAFAAMLIKSFVVRCDDGSEINAFPASATDDRHHDCRRDWPDFEAGWNAYRRELLETVGMTMLPTWEKLPDQVKESWCVGVRASLNSQDSNSNIQKSEA